MSRNKLPPLQLNNSETSLHSSNSSNQEGSIGLSARERRRIKKTQEATTNITNTTTDILPRSTRRARSLPRPNDGTDNQAFTNDDNNNNNESPSKQSDTQISNKPPRMKRQRNRKSDLITSNTNILEGLEEDVIEMDGYDKDTSQKELINNNDPTTTTTTTPTENYVKSVPTDKFYLELERKFEIQKKELYEKREQERLRVQFDWQLKQKQKESQKYQISTPRYALRTHKFLRTFFLFIHGLNVGYQFWHLIIIFLSNYNAFKIVSNYTNGLDLSNLSKMLIFFENLTMPIHCLNYFLLTICIVDSIDRVDFTNISLKYFGQCLAFQNQFWSIVAYSIALICSLALIQIDQTVYSLTQLSTASNVTSELSSQITNTINSVLI
jgi:hypothetical protein